MTQPSPATIEREPRLFTMDEAAGEMRVSRRWLGEWLRENPTSEYGRPHYIMAGRKKLFRREDFWFIKRGIETLTAERAKQNETAKADDGFIYFIEAGDFIKIGYTRSPASRAVKMMTDSPHELKLLHFEPGTFKREKVLHRHFADIRVRGEWFEKTPELLAHIERRKLITGAAK